MSLIYLRYGAYTHAVSDAAVSISRATEYNDAGLPYATRETWTIRGRLIADSQAELTTAIQTLQNYYRIQNQPISLRFENTNAATAHFISPLATIDGVRVVMQPSYPIGQGAQYSRFRDYSIVVEARVKITGAGTELVSWQQRISFEGGQPRKVIIETLNTLPVIQQTAAHTAVVVTQMGRAVGLNDWPAPAPWLFPGAAIYTNQTANESPRTTFVSGVRLDRLFPTSWNYVFGLSTPVIPPREANIRPFI